MRLRCQGVDEDVKCAISDISNVEENDMCNFRVGQKVVCVDDRHCFGDLVKGGVYTVANVSVDIKYSLAGTFCTGIELVETKPDGPFLDFAASRFLPVVERKTDISVFRAMLNTSHEKLGAD